MTERIALQCRLTPERWRLAVDELGAAVAARHRRTGARIRSVIPLSDAARFAIGMTAMVAGLVLSRFVAVLRLTTPVFVIGIVLFCVLYLPAVRRAAERWVDAQSLRRARQILQRYQPASDDGVGYDYELDGATLRIRVESGNDRTVTLPRGSQALVTAHVAVVLDGPRPIAVVFRAPDEVPDELPRHLRACAVAVAVS